MFYYIAILVIVTVIAIVNSKYIEENNNGIVYSRNEINITGFIAVIILLILFECLRDMTVGTDTPGYCRRFMRGDGWLNWGDDSNFIETEPLFGLTMEVAHHINANYISLLFVVSTISVTAALISIRELSVNFTISLFTFVSLAFYLFGFAAMRQGIALCIFMYSFKYIIDKSLYKFLIVVLIGALFHKTLFIAIIAYFVTKIKFNKKNLILIILITFIGTYLIKGILSYSATIDSRYAYYSLETHSSASLLTLFAVFLASFYVFYRRIIPEFRLKVYDSFLYMTIMSACIYALVWLTNSNVEITRFAMYFQVASVFLCAEFYNAARNRKLQLPILFILCLQLGYYIVYISKIGGITNYILNNSIF